MIFATRKSRIGCGMNKVLIVEDSDYMAFALAAMLRPICSHVDIALTWRDAVTKVATRQFTVVAVDLMLPDSAREKTLDRLPELTAVCPDIRIVVMSGFELNSYEERQAMSNGAVRCILKTAEEFRKTIIGLASAPRPRTRGLLGLVMGFI